jgi:hypothetical protein
MTVHLGPLAGTLELYPESDYGYAIYIGIMPVGGATLEEAASDKRYLMKVPADGKGLQHYLNFAANVSSKKWKMRSNRRSRQALIKVVTA